MHGSIPLRFSIFSFARLQQGLLTFIMTCVLLLAMPVLADQSRQPAALPADLHLHPAWLDLGHYRTDTLRSGYRSEADDATFFLSPSGKTSPQDELIATVQALRAPGTGDEHARCRFPARDRWLRQQIGLPAAKVDCPAYERWLENLDTSKVTLVFAASYLNSPSSMFGHTFLRLDPPGDAGDADLLLASTISYAADAAEHDGELLFAYRGIFGGYPGITTVKPYYQMIRLYSDIENRDLWEYQLNLNKAEIAQLLAHAWEVQAKNFDYYFFDENCAYRLLALLDVARPGSNLLAAVNTHAIPSDTVRWVMRSGMVEQVYYRPSAATVVGYAIEQLPEGQRPLAHDLAYGRLSPDSANVQQLGASEQSRLLDVAYDYQRYQAQAGKLVREQAAPVSHQLLLARSRLMETSSLQQVPVPDTRDDQGHETMRLGVAGGRQGSRNYAGFSMRPAYHDLLDPLPGYRPGAQLQFLAMDARLYTDSDELQLERLTAVEIRSLTPRDRFFQPKAWQVGFGARRRALEDDQRRLVPYLEGGRGASWLLAEGLQTYALATGDLEIGKSLEQGYDLAPGVNLGLLYQDPAFSLSAGSTAKFWMTADNGNEAGLYLGGSRHLGRDLSLNAKWTRNRYPDRYENQWQLTLYLYY
jgi:hypothetical protein